MHNYAQYIINNTMKILIRYIYILFFVCFVYEKASSSEKIKIGLVVPLSGEYGKIGNSIINATRLALNSINNDRIQILPRDNKSDPTTTLNVAKKLYEDQNVKIIIGPIFKKNNIYLDRIPEVTFLSLTNKLSNNPDNVISAGVNAISQLKAIKKFTEDQNLKRTVLLKPNSDFKNEIDIAISNLKINLKDNFIYESDPTVLTSQIEKITKYNIRKQNLLDEIKRVENSDDPNKEKKIEKLKKRDTIGGLNFDSVIIADFDENLKSVATSLLYTDVSTNRVHYITLNQWFDKALLKDKSLQPIYFPSINKNNYEEFIINYELNFNEVPNQISFLSYDIAGLVYYLIYKNNFKVEKEIFYEKNKFKGKIGVFEINKNIITHELNFYVAENEKFKKIF